MIRQLLYFLVAEFGLTACIVTMLREFVSLGIPLGGEAAGAVGVFATLANLFIVILIISTFRKRWICAVCSKHYKAEFIRGSGFGEY